MADCVKCGGSTEEGFISDTGYGTIEVAKWQEGSPQKSFWTGIKKDGARLEIMTCAASAAAISKAMRARPAVGPATY